MPSSGHGYRKLPEGHFIAFRGSAWEMTPGGPQRIILKHFGDQLGKWPQEAPRWSFRSIPRPSEENSPRKHPEGHFPQQKKRITSCTVARAKCACCWRGKHTRLVSKKCSGANPGFRKCACCWWGNAAKTKKRQSDTARSQKQSALVVGAKMGAQPRKATPWSWPLLKRILQRESKKQKQQQQKNTQRSKPATGNHDNKKTRLGPLCFTCV